MQLLTGQIKKNTIQPSRNLEYSFNMLDFNISNLSKRFILNEVLCEVSYLTKVYKNYQNSNINY